MRRVLHSMKCVWRALAPVALVGAALAAAPAPALAQTGTRVPVTLWWNSNRAENVTTRVTLVGFERIRVEGYLFANPHPGTVPVKTFYHDGRDDYALVGTAKGEADMLAAGYRFVRTEGYGFPQPFPAAVPLKLYWNQSRNDHATVAHSRSEQDQKNSGYSYVRVEAYLFPADDPDFGARTLGLGVRKVPGSVDYVGATKTAFVVHQDLAGNGCRYSWIGTTGDHPHDVVLSICDSGIVGMAMDDGVPYEVDPFTLRTADLFENRVPPTQLTPAGTVIDVGITYSPAVVSEWGAMAVGYGLRSIPAETYLDAYMQLAVDHTNAILGASGVGTTLRLANTKLLPNLLESSFNSVDDALGAIAERGYSPCDIADDPYKVKAFRNYTGADLVSVWLANRPSGYGGGAAWLSPSTWYCDDKLAFSVVWGADVVHKSYTFAHEIGHNLGVIHGHGEPTAYVDWDIFQSVGYMYGHVDAANGFRDLMSYGDRCAPNRSACPRLPYYSTPGVWIDPATKARVATGGVAMGSSSANAARRIRERSGAVGGFRALKCPGIGGTNCSSGGGVPNPNPSPNPEDPPVVVK